jgi:hypothetical protein
MPSFDGPRVTAAALLGLGLTLALAVTVAAPAHADEAAVAAAAPQAAAPQDYYTRRASEILKRDEKLNAVTPHPLAAAYPAHSIVVCEAGCSGERGAEVVFMERREAAAAEPRNMMAHASGGAGSAAKQQVTIDCVGGCYDTPRQYQAPRILGQAAVHQQAPPVVKRPKREPFDPRY